tara:strand:- start:2153 stop:3109 length:957 start_codon:yes stop_codon:yes gene_type:complete
MINKNSKIFIAGHKGMVGSAIHHLLKKRNFKNIITVNKKIIDLRDQNKVYKFLKKKSPDAVIIAAAKVGGIYANNKFKANFIYDNLQIQNNLIHGSYLAGVNDLIFLGSSCIYPKNCKQPIKESFLLSNYLEKTNDAYAVAKIAGIKLCQSYNSQYKTNYKCLLPCNAYGPNDNYDETNSHFFPALIKKIVNAIKDKKNHITIWGDGTPRRELIFSYDLADAIIYFLNKKTKEDLINIGTNDEKSIYEFAIYIMKFLKVDLNIKFKNKNLNGTSRKKLDISLAKKYGWNYKIPIRKGLPITISDYLESQIFNKYKIDK